MSKHRYYPMDILFLEDEKIELINSEIGDVAIAILSKTWAKLAQMDKADYSYPANWKMLKLAIKSTSSVKTIEKVIRDFGLFTFEGEGDNERFYSPRLREHFRVLDDKADTSSAPNREEAVVTDRRGRILSKDALERMARGGKKYRPLDQGSTKVETKVDQGSTKVETKVDQGLGGTIGGAKRPLKEERLKDKDIRSLPQTPSGGLEGAQEEGWDAERRAIAEIQDPKMRDWVERLLTPTPNLNSYAEVWKEIYAVDTSGVSSFSSPPKVISREMREKAEELYWALVPDPADGSQRPEWRRASPEEVLSIIQRFRSVLQKAKESSFFAKSPPCASLSWIIKLDNFSKIEAGNYRDPEPATAPSLGSRGMVNQNWVAVNEQAKARVPTQEELDAIEFAKKFTPEDVPF